MFVLTDKCFQIKLIAGYGGWVGFRGYTPGSTTRYWQMDVTYTSTFYNSGTGAVIGQGNGTIQHIYDPATGDVSNTTTWTPTVGSPGVFGFPYDTAGPAPTSSGAWTYSPSGDTSLTVSYADDPVHPSYTTVSVITLSTPYTLSQAEADLDAAIAVWQPGYGPFDSADWNTITYADRTRLVPPSNAGEFDNRVVYSYTAFNTADTPTAITPDSPYLSGVNPEVCVAWSVFFDSYLDGGVFSQTLYKCVGWINMAGDYAVKTYEQPTNFPVGTPATPTRTDCGLVTAAGCGSYFQITPESVASDCVPRTIQDFKTITPGGTC